MQLVYVLVFKRSCGTGRAVFRPPNTRLILGFNVLPHPPRRIRFRALQRSAKSAMPSSRPLWSRISRCLLDLATQIRNTWVYVPLMLGKTANYKQDMQFMRNVRGTFVQPFLQFKSNKYYILWVCVCGLSCPARNAHAPYCHLWSALLYNIFPHYLINGTIS